jgi:hypothetical protein
MWTRFEPIHAVTYFAPESRERFEAAGLRGFWRGYFAGRAAPLGSVDAAPVVATFFSFAPAMVARAIPDVWSRAAPDAALTARMDGAVAALRRLWHDVDEQVIETTADLLEQRCDSLDCAGRVLGAANVALPRPVDPVARVWQATTTLREHRGDGHVAALVAAGRDGCTTLVWRGALDLGRDMLQPNRGWSDDEWESAQQRLIDDGWLDGAGRPTAAGLEIWSGVEVATDRAAAQPWDNAPTAQLAALLTTLAAACQEALPFPNPIGLPGGAARS